MLAELLLAAAAVITGDPCPSNDMSQPCVVHNQAIIEKYVGAVFHLAWACPPPDCPSLPTQYEVEFVETKTVEGDGKPERVRLHVNLPATQLNYDWTPAKAGLYYARVRACIGTDGTNCSIWVNSWDHTQADPAKWPRGFLMRATLPPATNGGVN